MSGLSPTLTGFLDWLAGEQGRAANTVAAYRADVSAYEAWTTAEGVALDAPVVDRYLAALHDAGRKPSSAARTLAAIRALHRFLGVDGTTAVARPAVPAAAPEVLTDGEVDRLLAAAEGRRRDRAVLAVLVEGGLRVSELVALDLADAGDAARSLSVRVAPHPRQVSLAPAAAAWLRAWVLERGPGAGPLFPNARGGRLTRQGAWVVVQRCGRAAGLGDRVTPQVLRHTCADRLAALGLAPAAVDRVLGRRGRPR